MKDALGHGSNGSGDGTMVEALRARLPQSKILRGGGIPQSSNAAAAQALFHTLKSTQAPVHEVMTGGQDAVRGIRKPGHSFAGGPITDLKGRGR